MAACERVLLAIVPAMEHHHHVVMELHHVRLRERARRRFFTLQSSFHNLDWRKRCVSMKLSTSSKAEDSKVVWTPNLVRQVKRAFRIVRRDEDGRNCVRRGKRPHLLLTLCSTIDLCTPNTSNCRRTGWRGQQTPIAPTLSAHNLLNFPAPSQLKLWDRCS
ncbi:uncharacterized protein [Procambarus clarkii]|uniref:uncharacterized protein isoform X1 n=1 Tax=Procambarus clarkii TaxID=6728 RepID=UPI003744172F